MKPLWSEDYEVTPEEIDDLYDAIGRRNGVFALSKSADFVGHHKRNADRLSLDILFHALKDSVSFHVVGSAEDPFEGRQAVVARERLGPAGLDVRSLPGGHLTTSEHPDLLVRIIEEVVTAKVGGRTDHGSRAAMSDTAATDRRVTTERPAVARQAARSSTPAPRNSDTNRATASGASSGL